MALYICNATAGSLFFKKNDQSSLNTLVTVAVFGLIVSGIVFLTASFFVDVQANVSLGLVLLGALRGVLIVVGLFFVSKAFRLVPVSVMSPLGMIFILPLLALSWIIFGDSVGIAVIVLVLIMLSLCTMLVLLEGTKTDKDKPSRRKFWLGIIYFGAAMVCFLSTQIITRVLGENGMHALTIAFINASAVFVAVLTVFVGLRRNPIRTLAVNMRSPAQIGIGITDTIWIYLYVPLVMAFNLGVLNAVSRISVALTVLAGLLIFKEKVRKPAYFVIAGILVIGIIIGILSV